MRCNRHWSAEPWHGILAHSRHQVGALLCLIKANSFSIQKKNKKSTGKPILKCGGGGERVIVSAAGSTVADRLVEGDHRVHREGRGTELVPFGVILASWVLR